MYNTIQNLGVSKIIIYLFIFKEVWFDKSTFNWSKSTVKIFIIIQNISLYI